MDLLHSCVAVVCFGFVHCCSAGDQGVKAAVQSLEKERTAKVHFHDISDIRKALTKEGFSKDNLELLLQIELLKKLFENQEIYSKDIRIKGKPFTISAHINVVEKECWFNRVPIR